MEHSKNAMKKTVASFVCLAVMLIVSFIVSEYEYTHIDKQVDSALKSDVIQHAFYNNHSVQHQPAQKMMSALKASKSNVTHDKNEKIIHLQNVAKYNNEFENQIDLNKIIKTSTEGISTVVSIAATVDWKNQILSTSQYGEPLMRFTLCAIISFGALLKLTY